MVPTSGPLPVEDTPEVAAAKAEHLTQLATQEQRRKRSTILAGAPALVGDYALSAGGQYIEDTPSKQLEDKMMRQKRSPRRGKRSPRGYGYRSARG